MTSERCRAFVIQNGIVTFILLTCCIYRTPPYRGHCFYIMIYCTVRNIPLAVHEVLYPVLPRISNTESAIS